MAEPLLSVTNLRTYFNTEEGVVRAVDGVSFDVAPSERRGVVGESGSGKSVTAMSIMRLIEPPAGEIVTGEVVFNGTNLLTLAEDDMQRVRGGQIAMIFQDPMTALNPVYTIGDQLMETIMLHQDVGRREAFDIAVQSIEDVQIPGAKTRLETYPHELSGGMRQRIMIAMGLSCNPDLLIADEPTTALDVTTQAEILRLINDLKDVYDNATVFITHDFGVVADVADRVAVMCWGKVIEEGTKEDILLRPQEDYTKLLVDAMPLLETTRRPDLMRNDKPVVEVKSMHKIYGDGSKQVHALNDASFVLRSGETLGVVGESGSGKSTLAKTLIRLQEPTAGAVMIRDQDFLALSGADLDKARQQIQMIFQDPYGSLNPSQTVGFMVTRGLHIQGVSASQAKKRAIELLDRVGLKGEAYNRTPRNFSGRSLYASNAQTDAVHTGQA